MLCALIPTAIEHRTPGSPNPFARALGMPDDASVKVSVKSDVYFESTGWGDRPTCVVTVSGGTRVRAGGTGGSSGAQRTGRIAKMGGDPIILGPLDKCFIDAVIKRNQSEIRDCYQEQLSRNPGLGGKIVVKFVIAKDGTVSKASTKSSTMNNKSVEGCLNSRFEHFKFPEPKGGGIVIVSYPIVFEPG